MVLEIALHNRQIKSGHMPNLVKVAIGCAEEERWGARLLGYVKDRLDAQFGEAPTVIAYTIEGHQIVRGLLESGHGEQLPRQLSFPVTVTDGDTVSKKSRAVRSLPPEHISRKSLFMRLGTHENVGIHPL